MILTRQQQGQAIAEFNVTAVFLLVPLFILVPLLGKYIDMKHTSVQAARYMAWERTVWFEEAPKYTSTAAVKSTFILEKETISRVFGDTDKLVSASDSAGLGSDEVNLLWKDNAGRQLVDGDAISVKIPNGDEAVPSMSYQAFNILTNIIDIPANYIGDKLIDGLEWFNDGAEALTGSRPIPVPNSPLFDIVSKFHFEGYYRPEVKVAVNNIPYLSVFDNLNLEIESHAAILTDSWSAAGNEGKRKQDTQFAKWADSFVPFARVRPLFKPAQDIFSYKVLGVSIAPELGADSLIFGFVDTDPVTDSSIIPACPAGVCSFE
ncbi:hypothetical protein MNBD_GAMMA23-663 [hydrothermal vent metagenome]|uniref:Uncharacterized protein n=1 Tax=hydrothermal vent metagenome TaxID=652676 RepID=A0A3B1AIC3_9ZZZZ